MLVLLSAAQCILQVDQLKPDVYISTFRLKATNVDLKLSGISGRNLAVYTVAVWDAP
jgi:hypothetical protein